MAIVRKHRCQVTEVRQPLPDVYVARFASQDRPFQYQPGQFLHLALDPYDASRPWPESRCFSIMTPAGGDPRELGIAFAVKGAFTLRMSAELVPGREIWLKLPYGELFAADWSGRTCVFLAGGTGVTPFLSLFGAPAFARFTHACLYLGVRSASHDVFAAELAQAQRGNPAFAVEVRCEDTQGLIPIDQVRERHGPEAVYFLSGPVAMIRAFRARLLALGVPAEQIRSDDWE
jgi:ferredoxin-NADP reductase